VLIPFSKKNIVHDQGFEGQAPSQSPTPENYAYVTWYLAWCGCTSVESMYVATRPVQTSSAAANGFSGLFVHKNQSGCFSISPAGS